MEIEHVIINGELRRLELAQLPVIDRAILWGESLREDVLLLNSQPFRLQMHIDMLARSLALPEMGFSYALNKRRLERNIATLASRSEIYTGAVRIILTPGNADVGAQASILLKQEVNEIVLLNRPQYSVDRREQGLNLDYACYRMIKGDLLSQFRIGVGMRENIALRKVRAAGFDEAVVCDQDGALLSTAGANIFAVVDGAVITPHPQKDGVVNGVMRQVVIETLAREGIMLFQESLFPEITAKATELFLAGAAVGGVVKVRKLAERVFTDFTMTDRIIDAVDRRIIHELPAL